MVRKRLDVVEINKKEKKIVLEENDSPLLLFWRHHRLSLFITMLILSLTVLSIGILVTVKNLYQSQDGYIKQVSLDTSLDKYTANVASGDRSLTSESAKEIFNSNSVFKTSGEAIIVKTIDNAKMTIKYYSDGTAIRIVKSIGTITRINPLPNGAYGVNENGIIYANATNNTVTIKETKNYPWGMVTYYSDGSASVNASKLDLFVRNGEDINDNFIANHKVSYLKESRKIGSDTLNYYYDGTIQVIKNGKSYLVRTENDLDLSNNDVKFKNNNASSITSTKRLNDGTTIYYYQDGGAIISKNNETISVRKSNSIVIKDNKIYEIIDSQYATVSSTKNNVTYYTNGGAITTYNGVTYYISENSDIKFTSNGEISSLPNNKEKLVEESNVDNGNIKMFEHTAVVTTSDYIAILPKEKVMYDVYGNIKELVPKEENGKNSFTIVNNTNEKLNYRIVIQKSNKTNLDEEYLRYQLSTNNEYIAPTKLNDNLWGNDAIGKSFKLKGTNYILLESTIEAHDTENVSIMFWTDYDTIPNSMQDKYFYGTIKVYAWSTK